MEPWKVKSGKPSKPNQETTTMNNQTLLHSPFYSNHMILMTVSWTWYVYTDLYVEFSLHVCMCVLIILLLTNGTCKCIPTLCTVYV